MRRSKALLALAGLLALMLVVAGPAGGAKPKGGPVVGPVLSDAKAWIVTDPRDGSVIASKGADRELPIASTTKLMTAYLALQHLKLKQRIAAPKYNATDAESLLGLRVGEKLSVRDLMYALVLESANDAAETLAVGVSGSVPAFVQEMNDAALALGLTETHYSTPVGLDAPGNYSSARDLTTLAGKLLENPFFAKVADSPSATLKTGDEQRQIGTRVLLLNSYPFISGIKTGHTLDAGYVLVGSGEKNGTTLISAVLGTPSEGARDADTLKLLRYGFSQYKPSTPVEKGQEFEGPELDYGRGTLEVAATQAIPTSVRPGQKIATEVDVPDEIKGRVDEGAKVGEVRVTVDGRVAGTSPLVSAEAVGPAGIFRKAMSALSGPLLLIPLGALVLIVGLLLAGGHRPHRPRAPHLPQRKPRKPKPEPPRPEPLAPPVDSDPPDPGTSPSGNGDAPRVRARKQKREKGPRTPEERERMRKERMERRTRQRDKDDPA
jgi:serine-type D-Ala-D-Ala carboxypeptidase (penicillin-binding protein 5/6)